MTFLPFLFDSGMVIGYINSMKSDYAFHFQRGSFMDLNFAHQCLLAVQQFPVDRQGGILLQTIHAIEEAEKANPVLANLHCDIDKAVMDWFNDAIVIEDTDNALLDEDIVNIARIISTGRLSRMADDCEIIEAYVVCARNAVTMADMYGVDQWWTTAVTRC